MGKGVFMAWDLGGGGVKLEFFLKKHKINSVGEG